MKKTRKDYPETKHGKTSKWQMKKKLSTSGKHSKDLLEHVPTKYNKHTCTNISCVCLQCFVELHHVCSWGGGKTK